MKPNKFDIESFGFEYWKSVEYDEDIYSEEKMLVDQNNELFHEYRITRGVTVYSVTDMGYYWEFSMQAAWMDEMMVLARIETMDEMIVFTRILFKEYPRNPLFQMSNN